MNCYQCGSKLGSGRLCLRCGADVSVYRRIIHVSNNYYNAGLEKARLRDLSGAVEALSKSLQFDKRNTDARNLLGLVYYEMGEVVEALSQWVISKNFKPKDNLADDYLNELQANRNQLENMNQAIKKFNQALSHARHDGRDLAIIQLKRVLKQQPNLIKAYQLLALLYIEENDYSKAGRLLKRALKIDRGNTLCLKYSRMIRGKLGKSTRSSKEKYYDQQAQMAILSAEEGQEMDVIVPAYKERSSGARVFLGVLAGMAIALCLYQFVILRTINRNNSTSENQAIAAYDMKLSDKELEIQTLKDQIETLQNEQTDLSDSLTNYTGADGVLAQYDALLNVVEIYMAQDPDLDKLAEEFGKLEENAVDSQAYRTVYEAMKQYVAVDMVEEVFEQGERLFNTDYYARAIPYFEQCLEMNPEFDKAVYYIALSYENQGKTEESLTYFQKLVDDFPESEYVNQARRRLD